MGPETKTEDGWKLNCSAGFERRYNLLMGRWLAIAALGAALLGMPAWAQHRGGASFGMAGRAGFGHAGFGARGPAAMHRGPAFGFAPRGGVHFGTSFRRPVFSPNRFHHHRFFGGYRGFYPGYGALYLYPGYYGYADYYEPDYAYASSYQSYTASPDYSGQINQMQQNEINRLEDEVERLREQREEQQSARLNPPRPEAQAKSEPQPATVLVFRDQHTQEVQNYAIVGKTLWVFSEQRASKIPLATLDIPATQKTNDDRGVDFRLPQ
jgi:hypothetical protein